MAILQQIPDVNGSSIRPRVLISEKISSDGLLLLGRSLDVDERNGLSAEQLIQIIGDYDAIVVRSETQVTASLLQAGKRLRVVARAGVGVDNVDLAAATKLGIIVVNSPQGNINAAAEHTITLLMAVARNIGDACSSLKAGKWERGRLVGVEVKGKTLAIIGLGKGLHRATAVYFSSDTVPVGLTVARAAGGLGMNLVAYDPYANPSLAASANVVLLDSVNELFERADFLTLHTPKLISTTGMISTTEFSKMKPTARILNVARGGIVDEAALLSALEKGLIAGAGIDVFTSEPPQLGDTASALIAHPKVVATPHLGASTAEAQENVSIDVCTQVFSILSGQLPRYAVNMPIILPEEYRTLLPFVILLEKMGSLYMQHFSSANAAQQVRTTFDIIYEGSLASSSTTQPLFAALVKGLLSPITSSESLNINMVNAELVASERGILINESRARAELEQEGYSASVTLKAHHDPRSPSAQRQSGKAHATPSHGRSTNTSHVISGFVANNIPYISRLGRFRTSFVPDGTLLICRNYDSPGKIGVVGGRLGKAGVNIRSMTVAPIEQEVHEREDAPSHDGARAHEQHEALMILGVDRAVDDAVRKSLIGEDGVVEASVVLL
nr:d-3-phosphoglycerate dehydrogenase 2, chloroplastic [Quercus suber]